MYEEIKDRKIYEELKDKINNLEINEVLKEGLNNLNNHIWKMKYYNLEFKIRIIIDNCSNKNIGILLENITFILKEYSLHKKIVTYSNTDSLEITEDFLDKIVLVDNYYMLDNNEGRYYFNYNELKSFVNRQDTSFILTCEGDFQELYNKLFRDKTDYVMKNAIHLTDNKKDLKSLVLDLKMKYKDNNITCEIDDIELSNIIDYLINEHHCYNANCVSYCYNTSINKMLLEKLDSITVECFDKYQKNEKKTNKKRSLDNLIGIKNVKDEIESLKNYLEFRKKANCDFEKPYLNMFFMGEPGTGKTTVARYLADILYEMEYLEKNNVVEIIPTDLMGNYVGHTKDTTREILNKAKGGLLFIDEAYLIYQSESKSNHGNAFMNEALIELMKYLENPANVVVFAGYPSEMKSIYKCNPGIASRIYKEIYFENYSKEELYLILEKRLLKMNIKVSNKAKNKILKILNEARLVKGFGNARFCEQYAQKLILNHANNKLKRENYTISLKDVCEIESNNKRKMGFRGD